ncbi:hypothetical protein J2Z22_001244 [Paenibacillus forsythiae]|uniref:Uncharacterized protein n=1 Tax=Paenibacillus forsythiae TaxID=365616 RepID=A0ABU3H4H7_9BACL|nr:hypothetical protein [Paenibacillus forsythiae]MDT3425725.1 hypothetical protein [Paenibacillus forsythiae]
MFLVVNLGDRLFGPAAPLGTEGTGWSTEHKLIPYDWNAAADLAERNGRPGYATCDPQRKSAVIRPCAIGLPI